ncbi:PLP-dependent aminotransferase family protein [Wukongibacter baidiensis]|uniref:aminotransferase-like domain-containing protein n=1 Tax=Wukongibacter baidiensis TaxID=1723361 RepID=UPI003D7F29B1
MRKYIDIAKDIENNIEKGKIQSGTKLPSVRNLANKYECSINTIVKAYEELKKKHLVYSVGQSGYYVVDSKKSDLDLESKYLDFSSPSPDLDGLPYLDFKHCVDKSIDLYKKQLFTYQGPYGFQPLKEILVKHFMNYQIFTKADNMVITSGSQQALSLLSRMAFPNGKKKILIEQPSYCIYLRLLELENFEVITIERNFNGIDLEELERIFRTQDIKFFYTMPRFHFPLGTSFSLDERKAIASLALKYDVYVVEDDYMADMEIDNRYDPIFTLGNYSHVVYLKTFSKILIPGLRVGVAVLPDNLIEKFRLYKHYTDFDTSPITQATLEIYLKNGMFDHHKDQIKSIYIDRMECLKKELQKYDTKNIQYSKESAGFYMYLILPNHINDMRLIERLKDMGVLVMPGRESFFNGFITHKSIVLSISRVTKEEIKKGVQIIINEINRYSI